ncbi:phospholipase [Lithospermum erythrorhizon]|uniref:Phospholipase n=1 Tax=Lithospermum erythrorhizon TaxID=34254 RepID=A0AAV3REM2_LITER
MASTAISFSGSSISKICNESLNNKAGFSRSSSCKDLRSRAAIGKAFSDNHLCYFVNRIRASSTPPKLKNSSSMGGCNLQLPEDPIPVPLKTFLFDEQSSPVVSMNENVTRRDHENELMIEGGKVKRANWMERLTQIRSLWRGKLPKANSWEDAENKANCNGCETEDGLGVDYDDGAGKNSDFDEESFTSLLGAVSWSDTKLFSQLAFLCNMAYAIPKIKGEDLRRYYGLNFVTSSLVKKAEAAAMKAKSEKDSPINPISSATTECKSQKHEHCEQRGFVPPSVAYKIAASAATYMQSRAKDILKMSSEPQLVTNEVNSQEECYKDEKERLCHRQVSRSEMAAQVAAATMTAVVAADEEQKQEAARDLQSLNSSPCEWFICDDSNIYTRCFVIQGSDSLASWQANLFFEPTNFEGSDVLVHRGIYEAAKGIYEQFMPEIMEHINRFGNRAKLQFTGHSLGGSLALLVNIMLLSRKVVNRSTLLPVVTFGSPFIFCGGSKMLEELGLNKNHVHCVIMHRDIVPKAFSCTYPDRVVQILKRVNGTFRSHPCLIKNKCLYSPMGKIFILQPDEKTSPPISLLPPGSGLYTLEGGDPSTRRSALKTFLNSPHPLETLSHPAAYGSDGTIMRDHDSSNYLKAVNDVIIQHTRRVAKKDKKKTHLLWPLLTSQSPHAWGHKHDWEASRFTNHNIVTGA